jgi:hypothetical protein
MKWQGKKLETMAVRKQRRKVSGGFRAKIRNGVYDSKERTREADRAKHAIVSKEALTELVPTML